MIMLLLKKMIKENKRGISVLAQLYISIYYVFKSVRKSKKKEPKNKNDW